MKGRHGVSGQAGFSLVELLVGLAIGTLVISGAGTLLVITLESFSRVEQISRRQQVLVYAANTLVRDLRNAKTGYAMARQAEQCVIQDPEGEVVVEGLYLPPDGRCDYLKSATDDTDDMAKAVRLTLRFPPLKGADNTDGTSYEEVSFQVVIRQAWIDG